MNNLPLIARTNDVKEAFTQNEWYLNGYEANIRIRTEAVAQFLGKDVPSNVADIGCGDGSLSITFLKKGSSVTFLDLSETMLMTVLRKIPEQQRPRVTLINADFFSASLLPASFDLAIFVGVLAYVENLDDAARELSRIISPGGTLLLEFTDASHPFGLLNFTYRSITGRFRAAKCTTHRHKSHDVQRAFMRAGFRPVKTFKYVYTLPILLRLVSQKQRYRLIRFLFGSVDRPRFQILGSENLVLYRFDGALGNK